MSKNINKRKKLIGETLPCKFHTQPELCMYIYILIVQGVLDDYE